MSTNLLTKVAINGYEIETYHPEAITPFEWQTIFPQHGNDNWGQQPYFIREVTEFTAEDKLFKFIARLYPWNDDANGPVGVVVALHTGIKFFNQSALFYLLRKFAN